MGQGEKGDGSPKRPRPKGGRVTLKWEAPPLSLPGEALRESTRLDTMELELPREPEGRAAEQVRAHAEPPAGRPGVDAWERQRPRLTPPPFRPPSVAPAAPEQNEGGALDLVDRRARPTPATDLSLEMSERYALGDYTAALRTAELILGRDPESEGVLRIAESCRERLEQLYRSRLGAPARVPKVAIEASAVRWLGLDHRAGFLLSRVDGRHTISEIVDMSGMPTLEALKTLVELLDTGAIRFEA